MLIVVVVVAVVAVVVCIDGDLSLRKSDELTRKKNVLRKFEL